jgi:hydrogenase maturation factor
MCLPLIARVLTVEGDRATVELLEGERVRASTALHPDVTTGQHVLLDRGLIIEVIAAEQVATLIEFYSELTDLWAEEDARSG